MAPHKRHWRVKVLALFVFLPMLILSACGSTGGGTVNGTTPSKGTVTVGGKKDVEAQLLTEMPNTSWQSAFR